jgi:hypothetical protein
MEQDAKIAAHDTKIAAHDTKIEVLDEQIKGLRLMNHDTKIAVLDEQIKGLREQQKVHAEKTDNALKDLFMQTREILEILNRGRGAFAFAVVCSGAVGAAIMSFVKHLLTRW